MVQKDISITSAWTELDLMVIVMNTIHLTDLVFFFNATQWHYYVMLSFKVVVIMMPFKTELCSGCMLTFFFLFSPLISLLAAELLCPQTFSSQQPPSTGKWARWKPDSLTDTIYPQQKGHMSMSENNDIIQNFNIEVVFGGILWHHWTELPVFL